MIGLVFLFTKSIRFVKEKLSSSRNLERTEPFKVLSDFDFRDSLYANETAGGIPHCDLRHICVVTRFASSSLRLTQTSFACLGTLYNRERREAYCVICHFEKSFGKVIIPEKTRKRTFWSI